MVIRNVRRRLGKVALLSAGALLAGVSGAYGQGTTVKTNLKKVLVLDKSQGGANGHMESRRDLNAALNSLATAKGFTVTFIGQNDPASKIATEFSAASLATYQAVIFSNNDGVHAQLNATEKANFEAYVKGGGGFIPVHAASAFISNWPWITQALVRSFYGPHGSNQPTANVKHDAQGTATGTETAGIFKGLTAPLAFLDEYYSFNSTPRGVAGVTILLTVDEASFSKPVQGPMGNDHPVVWAKTEDKGRVVHLSMGHSWSTNNVYTAKTNYLTNFLYGTLRYVAGDFLGCTTASDRNFNPDATKHDATACQGTTAISMLDGKGNLPAAFMMRNGQKALHVDIRESGAHELVMSDASGRIVKALRGNGNASYSLDLPAQSGIYTVKAKAGKNTSSHRFTVL